MKLGKLYRDVVSSLGIPEDRLRFLDITNAINQSITALRLEYIKQGLGYEFSQTEVFYANVRDFAYPFLFSAELNYKLLRSLPITRTIQNSLFWKTENELLDEKQSWSKGDEAIKDDKLYVAVDDISDENTFEKTFKNEKIRNYSPDNGLLYHKDDVVYESDTDTYWLVTSEYKNDKNLSANSVSEFDKLYWKELGDAFHEATYVPFGSLYTTKLNRSIKNHYPFSMIENKVYTTVQADAPFTITYVTEWEYVEGLDKELSIPDTMIEPVKNRSMRLLASKLKIDSSNIPEFESKDED